MIRHMITWKKNSALPNTQLAKVVPVAKDFQEMYDI